MKKRKKNGLLSDRLQALIKALSFLVLGLIFLFVPGAALSITLRIVGAILLVYEAFEIYSIVKSNRSSSVLTMMLISEVFLVIFALMLLINPLGAVRAISLIVAIYFIIFGAIGLYKSVGRKNTKAIVVNSITALIGILLLVLPYVFADLITIILGIALIVKGVNLLLPLINSNDKDKDNYYM